MQCKGLGTCSLYKEVALKIENRNGFVVEFNKLATLLTGCNSAVMPLGNSVQSKACLFYLSPYLDKDKTSIGRSIAIINKAREDVEDA